MKTKKETKIVYYGSRKEDYIRFEVVVDATGMVKPDSWNYDYELYKTLKYHFGLKMKNYKFYVNSSIEYNKEIVTREEYRRKRSIIFVREEVEEVKNEIKVVKTTKKQNVYEKEYKSEMEEVFGYEYAEVMDLPGDTQLGQNSMTETEKELAQKRANPSYCGEGVKLVVVEDEEDEKVEEVKVVETVKKETKVVKEYVIERASGKRILKSSAIAKIRRTYKEIKNLNRSEKKEFYNNKLQKLYKKENEKEGSDEPSETKKEVKIKVEKEEQKVKKQTSNIKKIEQYNKILKQYDNEYRAIRKQYKDNKKTRWEQILKLATEYINKYFQNFWDKYESHNFTKPKYKTVYKIYNPIYRDKKRFTNKLQDL